MRTYIEPEEKDWAGICRRPDFDDSLIKARVAEIVGQVHREGDSALRRITESVENRKLSDIEISREEMLEAAEKVSPELKKSIDTAARNVTAFHEAQKFSTLEVRTMPGVTCWQKAVPIGKAGIYIPGGTAPLFSTVLMLALPARIAGCREILMCTPAGPDGKIAPAVLYAASLCGVTRIYAIGGAQAIAALAYGTETVIRADKIFGPGNRYVAAAKRLVAEDGVAVDMFAGPSEVLVMADETADPEFVAADLLSQAEHGRDSQVCLVCNSREIVGKVLESVSRQIERLPRKEIAEAALSESIAAVFADRRKMIAFANAYAPEHLIVNVSEPRAVAEEITAAGSVFIGAYSPESAGDYASGTNHTLPTSGTAVAASGVNLDSFVHKITYQELTREGLAGLAGTITEMAEAEGLRAHAEAVRVRMNTGNAREN
jgi:histidinol dehydrogenase